MAGYPPPPGASYPDNYHQQPSYPAHPDYSSAGYHSSYGQHQPQTDTAFSSYSPPQQHQQYGYDYPPRDSQSAGGLTADDSAGPLHHDGYQNGEEVVPQRSRASSGRGSGGDLDLGERGGAKGGWWRQFTGPNKLAFLTTVVVQVVVVLVMIAIVFGKIEDNIKADNAQLRSIDVYLSVFALAAVYEILASLDALRLKNTIQLIGVCIFNVAMMVYSALMISQIREAIQTRSSTAGSCASDPNLTCFALDEDGLFPVVRKFIIVMPIILAAGTVILAYLTFRLYQDFGWDVYKQIGADPHLKKMYMWYQVFTCFLKFDAFFWIGFAIQFLILVLRDNNTAEFVITIIALPFTLGLLILGAIATRKEIKPLMFIFMIGELVGMAYFIYKLVRLFQPSQAARYTVSKRTLATFSIITLIVLILTFALSVKCLLQFGRGLKDHIPPYWSTKTRRQKRLSEMQKTGTSAGAGGAGYGKEKDEGPGAGPRMELD